ncbi:hypothetical protein, partial [Comamonas sp.]|uniref:hypothetical protein n=1 Tax=Comamonas sp. TaxID=34028 RepID=UPI0028A1DBA1
MFNGSNLLGAFGRPFLLAKRGIAGVYLKSELIALVKQCFRILLMVKALVLLRRKLLFLISAAASAAAPCLHRSTPR